MQYTYLGPQKGNQYYCVLEGEHGPPLSSAGGTTLRPCIGFVGMKFYVCMSYEKGFLFNGFADDSQKKWNPNKNVKILP